MDCCAVWWLTEIIGSFARHSFSNIARTWYLRNRSGDWCGLTSVWLFVNPFVLFCIFRFSGLIFSFNSLFCFISPLFFVCLFCSSVGHRDLNVGDPIESRCSFCNETCTRFVADIYGRGKWLRLLWCQSLRVGEILWGSRLHLWRPGERRTAD